MSSMYSALADRQCVRKGSSLYMLYKPHRDKTNKMVCAPSEDSDQPGHPHSLIRVFAVRLKTAWVLSYPLSAQRRLWSDWAYALADLSLRWAHMPFCWVCHDAAHMSMKALNLREQSAYGLGFQYGIWASSSENETYHMSISRENVSSGIFDQVTFKPSCSATEASENLDSLDIARIHIRPSKQWSTKVLFRLHGCAGWSAPLLFAYGIRHLFAWPGPYMRTVKVHEWELAHPRIILARAISVR